MWQQEQNGWVKSLKCPVGLMEQSLLMRVEISLYNLRRIKVRLQKKWGIENDL